MSKKLFLLDGMALVYRAYFVFIRNPMIDPEGRNVSAVFGFLNTLLELLDKQDPTHIAVAFDVSGPTFRHEEYPEYKAQREETPEAIREAIPLLHDLLDAFRIPVLTAPGFEADDIIGTLARRAEKEGFDTFMVTPDKDFAQLVDDRTWIWKPSRGNAPPEKIGVNEVLDQWGIERVEQVTDILGLAGDASDNIPGVPGIGPKTAQKLIAQYGSIESLLEHIDELKGKMRENLESHRERALLCKRLVTIRTDTPVDLSPGDLIRGPIDADRLAPLLARHGFTAFARRLFGQSPPAPTGTSSPPPPPVGGQGDLFDFARERNPEAVSSAESAPPLQTLQDVTHTYRLVHSREERSALAKELGRHHGFCFDTETTGLHPREARLVGIAFSVRPHEAWFVSLPPDETECRRALEPFIALFADERIEKTGHNLKFDLSVLREAGIVVRGPLFDTMLAHYLLDPDQRHALDKLAARLLNYRPIPITALIGEKKESQRPVSEAPSDLLRDYACEDADLTLQLREHVEPQLESHGLRNVFDQIECPLVPVLVEMESAGVAIDLEALRTISKKLERETARLEEAVHQLAGHPFNLNSPKQLGEVLFDELKLSDQPKKTKTGQYTTNEGTLEQLAGDHEIARLLLQYRAATKLKNTYVDALPDDVCKKTGRIHTSLNQAVTTTGRLASSNPNLQNIPVRTEQGQEIRRAFIARSKDFTLLAADYSQIELRIMAHLSGDPSMKDAFVNGEDIHTATAARVFGVDADDVTPDMRRKAKMVNFGIIYGISAFGLAQRLRIPRKEAGQIIESYFEQYPDVKRCIDRIIESARDRGYVETIAGRKRFIRDIHARNSTVRAAAERYAINAPIQGSAADLIKVAMIRIHDLLQKKEAQTRLLLQVHDELLFDLHRDEHALIEEIRTLMCNALPLDVPVEVDCGTGANWLDAH